MKYTLKLKTGFGKRSMAGFKMRGFLNEGAVVDDAELPSGVRKPSFPFELVPIEEQKPKRQQRKQIAEPEQEPEAKPEPVETFITIEK